MRSLILALIACLSARAMADSGMINFNFHDADVEKVVEEYAKTSGQKFVIDPNARGKITILNKENISIEEAFNQMSSALAVNGVAISKQNDEMVVMSARAIQRNLIDVSSELPPMVPTKMATLIINLKYVSADEINRQLRMLTSNSGEVFPFTHSNQLIITDWTPNLYRVSKLIKELDVPASGTAGKFAKAEDAYQKQMREKAKAQTQPPAKVK